jgi:hypothetical protein
LLTGIAGLTPSANDIVIDVELSYLSHIDDSLKTDVIGTGSVIEVGPEEHPEHKVVLWGEVVQSPQRTTTTDESTGVDVVNFSLNE